MRRTCITPAAPVVAIALAALVIGRPAADDLPGEDAFAIVVPRGLDPVIPVPADNPLTPERVELGRRLFFDPILSRDGSTSCATCHEPERAFAGDVALPEGVGGKRGRRNAPSLLNRVYGTSQFWDGRAMTLEEQALKPIESPSELDSSIDDVLARLRNDASYRNDFAQVFDDGVTADNLARAIASYERTLLSGDSPNDRFIAGEFTAISDAARKGRWIFESTGNCWRCHSGANFTDEQFHNTGVSWGVEPLDLGRFEVTGLDSDRGAFKTPGLRGVAKTAPFMHDGSMATLLEVIEFYRDGGTPNPDLDEHMNPLPLTDDDVLSLVAFLESLTGDVEGEVKLDPQGATAARGRAEGGN